MLGEHFRGTARDHFADLDFLLVSAHSVLTGGCPLLLLGDHCL